MASLAVPQSIPVRRRTDDQVRPALRVVAATPAADAGASAGYASAGPNWAVLGAIAAGHAAVIALLLATGVVQVAKAPPVEASFIEEIAEPIPETATPEAALQPVPVEIFAPDVIVETPVAAPPVVAVTNVAPPPNAVATPAVATGAGDAAVVPPDFSADQLDNPGPRYPAASRRAREEGTVTLKVLVSAEGRAQELLVATSSGFERLDEAALATVKRWKFVPATKAGRPVQAWVLVPVTFALSRG